LLHARVARQGRSAEQVPTRRDRTRQAVALTAKPIALLAAAIGFLLSALLALVIVVAGGGHARPRRRILQDG
jgi:hypothetical protein